MNVKNINIISTIFKFFYTGNERSLNVKKNILLTFFIKGLSIIVSLLLVPLLINYLNPTRYGIWITLSSIIAWFGFFDIGLGNGLRNKLAEAIAKKKYKLARIYVSTTYAMLIVIMLVVYFLFLVGNIFIDWVIVLNANVGMESELKLLAVIVFSFFCLRIIFQLFNIILIADQKPAKSSFFNLLANVAALTIIYLLTKLTESSLIYIGLAISGMPVLVIVIASVWFYNKNYKIFAPSINYVKFRFAKDLMSLGFKFFIIQIASVVLYQTSIVIITQLFGPENVTNYFVAFKYFSVITMIFGIILIPFWSAFTEANAIGDTKWIKNIMKKLQLLWLAMIIVVIMMLLVSNQVFAIWVGDKVQIDFTLSLVISIYVIINTWNGIYSHFLNGVGKITLQLYIGIFGMIINIPLAIFLGKIIGIEGVILANVILGFFVAWIYPFQYRMLIRRTAKGIWNK